MIETELHSSDEFFEECNEIINQELEHFDIKREYNEIIISRDNLMDICRHFYLYGYFINEDYKHPEK